MERADLSSRGGCWLRQPKSSGASAALAEIRASSEQGTRGRQSRAQARRRGVSPFGRRTPEGRAPSREGTTPRTGACSGRPCTPGWRPRARAPRRRRDQPVGAQRVQRRMRVGEQVWVGGGWVGGWRRRCGDAAKHAEVEKDREGYDVARHGRALLHWSRGSSVTPRLMSAAASSRRRVCGGWREPQAHASRRSVPTVGTRLCRGRAGGRADGGERAESPGEIQGAKG